MILYVKVNHITLLNICISSLHLFNHLFNYCAQSTRAVYIREKLFFNFLCLVANFIVWFASIKRHHTSFYCYLPRPFFFPRLQAPLNWGKKDEPVYVTEESGVVGLNFHQSKEALIYDSTNGIANHYDVRGSLHITVYYIHSMLYDTHTHTRASSFVSFLV